MNRAQQYMQMARGRGHQNFHNFVDDAGGYGNFVNQPGGYNASGPSQGVKPSMPYSIVVSSASGSAVSNFDVLGATQYLNNVTYPFDANGNLVIGSVTIYSATPNVTYRDLLYQTLTQVFTVGQTYLECSNQQAQITVPYVVTTKDSSGPLVSIPIKPKKDPYQNQNDVIMDSTVYRMDGFTKLTFNQILPNAVLSIDFYPQDNINPGRMLTGQEPGKSYGNPGIIRSSVAVIPGGGANFSGPTIIKSRL